MSGHSKWNNIQHRKGAQDKKRAKLFTKFGRELTIAAKEGGSDPNFNPRLRLAIEKAKAGNMPKDILERAIKKGSGELEGVDFTEMRYEGYGPAGTAFIVEAVTDNKNRTAADVRHIFDKAGGNLGTSGCVSYMFEQKGIIVIDKATAKMSEDDIMMLAIENGAEDFKADEECYEITTSPSEFSNVREALENAGIEFVEAEVQMVPSTTVELDDVSAEKMQRLIDNLEDLDDVMNVYHNWAE